MLVTFATCWYALNSKFPADTYLRWIRFILESVNDYFYLVIFTNTEGEHLLRDYFAPYYFENPNIKFVIKPFEKFYNYKYKNKWIKNHTLNSSLNNKSEWKLNMLWAEKTHFVNDVCKNNYFQPTDYYGWCDIGYFREGACSNFANPLKLKLLNKNKIYYARINSDENMNHLQEIVLRKNEHGLPIQPIPEDQNSVAGGFFVAHKSKIDGWNTLFDNKLNLYFEHNYLVKDDQIIIIDCILSEPKRFELITETDPENSNKNHWFQFRRFLS